MKLFEFLKNVLKNEKGGQDVPDGYCPNCWGNQEYEGKFFEAVKNEGVDIDQVDDRKGWVLDYAEKHLAGIQLKSRGKNIVCESCKVTYVPSEE